MSPRPPEDTGPDTLHWLFRPTKHALNWMVASWRDGWWLTTHDGWVKPEELKGWNYSAPAAPPTSQEADHRKAGMAECRKLVHGLMVGFVHENFSYDPSTGSWETRSLTAEVYDEALQDALNMIDAKIEAEFGTAKEPACG